MYFKNQNDFKKHDKSGCTPLYYSLPCIQNQSITVKFLSFDIELIISSLILYKFGYNIDYTDLIQKGSRLTITTTWIRAPDLVCRLLIVSPPLPMINPTCIKETQHS